MRFVAIWSGIVTAASIMLGVRSQVCKQFVMLCNSSMKLDNCNISHYRQYMAVASKIVMAGFENRQTMDELKYRSKGWNGYCYIEAILNLSGRILFIRFASDRSLMTGTATHPDWDQFGKMMQEFDAQPDGMQMIMDLDGMRVCPRLRASTTKAASGSFENQVMARFTPRSSIAPGPIERYTNSKFRFVAFQSDASNLMRMQPPVRTNSNPIDVYTSVLTRSRSEALTLYVYKCRANMGIMDLPCNSEVNVHLFMRQWVNSSTSLHAMDGDFNKDTDWRQKFLTQDIPLIILMSVVPACIAIHLTCITWLGLANPAAKVEV